MGCCKSYYCKQELAALEAENERLKKALSEQIDRDISGIFPGERALAERAGGVSSLPERAPYEVLQVLGREYETTGDMWAALRDALTTEPAAPMALPSSCADAQNDGDHIPHIAEPAAPEGRQEAVNAVVMSARNLAREYRPTMDKDILHSWASDAVKVIRALSTRPSEQAVTEAARAVLEWYERDGSVGGAVEPFEALKAAMEAGR